MILLLDNYDSFTYNLAQYLGELGCQVEVHRNDKITVEEIIRRKPERIVISPGPCTPQEAGISVELVERLAGKFPILGVCLGHQAIGAAFGGKIVRAPKLFHGKTSQIHHDGKNIFRQLPDPSSPRATIRSSSKKNRCRVSSLSLPKPMMASSWASAIAATKSKASSSTPNPSSPIPASSSLRTSCLCKTRYEGAVRAFVSHKAG
jgi:anthranilate synthase/aminodeoxychorismate synthase-like glutamine amidotransferase